MYLYIYLFIHSFIHLFIFIYLHARPHYNVVNHGKPNHKPIIRGWFLQPKKMVMTWGWFMALGLPHYYHTNLGYPDVFASWV